MVEIRPRFNNTFISKAFIMLGHFQKNNSRRMNHSQEEKFPKKQLNSISLLYRLTHSVVFNRKTLIVPLCCVVTQILLLLTGKNIFFHIRFTLLSLCFHIRFFLRLLHLLLLLLFEFFSSTREEQFKSMEIQSGKVLLICKILRFNQ